MILQEFLDTLRGHGSLPLVFDTGEGVVPAGYHVTEIKSVQVRSMDCGGRANAWSETVLQVWPPAQPEGEPMAVAKFLKIYDRVAGALEVDAGSHLRVEYGAQGEHAVGYLVEGAAAEEGSLRVRLAAPAVACKGRDRSVGDLPSLPRGSSSTPLAGPAAAERTSGSGSPLTLLARSDGAASCCGPAAGDARASAGGGCCS